MKGEDAKKFKELERENQRLKRIVADQALDIDMLTEVTGKVLTPELRRRAVVHLQTGFGVSERRACRVVGQDRSTQRRPTLPQSDEEERLRAWLRAFSRQRSRWGWRRAAACARKDGWRANRKRVQRLWRDEGLRVPCRRWKRPLRCVGVRVGALCPVRPNVVWALDFQFDQTDDARTLKLLNIVDEFTRECPAILVDRVSTPTTWWLAWTRWLRKSSTGLCTF